MSSLIPHFSHPLHSRLVSTYLHPIMAKPADHEPEAAEEPQQVAVEDAVMIADRAEHAKVSPWTISMLRLYGCLLIGYLCACMNGYDGSVIWVCILIGQCTVAVVRSGLLTTFSSSSGINGMDSYLQYFHMQVQFSKSNTHKESSKTDQGICFIEHRNSVCHLQDRYSSHPTVPQYHNIT